jgi:hypothetical protein
MWTFYRNTSVISISWILMVLCLPAQDSKVSDDVQAGTPASEQLRAKAAAVEPPPSSSLLPLFGTRTKPMFSWLSLGADFRLRHEYHNNIYSLNSSLPSHEYNSERYRLRFAATLKPLPILDLNMRLITERRLNFKPAELRWSKPDEIFFDAFNFSLKKPGGLPLTLTVGRQDISFGNGWVINEATPLDGSRSIFFDAARLTWDWRQQRTTIDLIGVANSALLETWLPAIRSLDKPIAEQRENGAIAYVANRTLPHLPVDGYFVYRHSIPVLGNGNRGDLYAAGSLVQWQITTAWRYRVEAALERGDKHGRGLRAFGETQRLIHEWDNRSRQRVHFGHEYLSGDDPGSSGTDQGWDPIWGRWPQWSEMLGSTYSRETRQMEHTNLQRLDFGWGCSPSRWLDLSFNYMPLFAPSNPFSSRPGYSPSGSFRGNYLQAIGRFKISDHLSAHLWSEVFVPGNYYSAEKSDPACFLRLEIFARW